MYGRFIRFTCVFMIFSMMMLNVSVPMAKAEMISTETSVTMTQNAENRATVKALLERSDVREFLTGHGVDIAEAQSRIDALSDQEVANLASQIEDMPAGAGVVGTIVGAAVLIFIVLLITDILGFTDVFPFTNAQN